MATKSKNYLLGLSLLLSILLLGACADNEVKQEQTPAAEPVAAETQSKEKKDADMEAKGIGKFTNVEISATLDKAKADAGGKVYDLKCSSCHKLTGEKLVGPGWKGVTERRKPEWVMNFATNTDEMIDKDPAAQAMLEECLVRMPNQSLSDDDARAIYEFMRKNDGVK